MHLIINILSYRTHFVTSWQKLKEFCDAPRKTCMTGCSPKPGWAPQGPLRPRALGYWRRALPPIATVIAFDPAFPSRTLIIRRGTALWMTPVFSHGPRYDSPHFFRPALVKSLQALAQKAGISQVLDQPTMVNGLLSVRLQPLFIGGG